MKSTNNMGREAFEKAIQEHFEGAEIQPSESLWAEIEASIANDEVARYRRGMAYYRWVAAAGVLLLVGVLGYLGYDSRTNRSMTDVPEISQTVPDHKSSRDDVPDMVTENQPQEPDMAESVREGKTEASAITVPGQQVAQPQITRSEENAAAVSGMNSTDAMRTPGDSEIQNVVSSQKTADSDLTIPMLPETITGVVVYPVDRKTENTVFWAGLNMAPGYFDPNYQQGSLQAVLPNYQGNSSNSSAQEDHNSGFSMAFGVEMGMQLSGRWQLSSGIQYLNNNVQSSTNLVLDNRAPVFSSTVESLDISDGANANVTYEPTELDNTFQFISIPLQAGYMLVDSRVKVQLNAGIASDVFLKNTITAVDRSLESITIDPGSDAPFNSVYFNGLFGAQASYEFLPRYLITLEPRYKMALSEFTKSNNVYSSMPSSFGIGVGVKYVFK